MIRFQNDQLRWNTAAIRASNGDVDIWLKEGSTLHIGYVIEGEIYWEWFFFGLYLDGPTFHYTDEEFQLIFPRPSSPWLDESVCISVGSKTYVRDGSMPFIRQAALDLLDLPQVRGIIN